MSTQSSEDRPDRAEQALERRLEVDVMATLRVMLRRLARQQDDAAADQAASIPYWESCPLTVVGMRAAAEALREAADSLPVLLAGLGPATPMRFVR